ncbi:hypothetical protein L1987_30414 [Smallanthus sonchifolius]|uniref:Uncharacterized protein n=1 Tax=Smallanthus sonchifolius TaxID=185202 RepID=A0ACB9I243_9ASTR|nr:hypothetical protein L1987_30414 [Smallanthus sonchifolius]
MENGNAKVGYVRLKEFNVLASKDLVTAMKRYQDMGATFFVLDLRDNLDGLVQEGIEIAKLFSMKGRQWTLSCLCSQICSYANGKEHSETLLVHKDLMENGGVNALLIELQTKGVGIKSGPRASSMLNLPSAPSYYHEYDSLACTIEIVDDVHAAIESLIINIRMEGNPFSLLKTISSYLIILFLIFF